MAAWQDASLDINWDQVHAEAQGSAWEDVFAAGIRFIGAGFASDEGFYDRRNLAITLDHQSQYHINRQR